MSVETDELPDQLLRWEGGESESQSERASERARQADEARNKIDAHTYLIGGLAPTGVLEAFVPDEVLLSSSRRLVLVSTQIHPDYIE